MSETKIELVRAGLRTTTRGLAALGHPEISASIEDAHLVKEAAGLVGWIANYVRERKAKIRPGERMLWGFWQLRFLAREGRLEVFEAEPGGTWRPGVTQTLTVHAAQNAACRRVGCLFSPPLLDATARVTKSVTEGQDEGPVTIERIEADPPDSGFRITAAEGESAERIELTLLDLVGLRPGLAQWLALAPGARVEVPA